MSQLGLFSRATANTILRAGLAALSASLGELPRNDRAWTYTISNGTTPYLTRTLFPRMGGYRVLLHRIWREDGDRHPHNHPWRTAAFLILSGGYREERDGRERWLGPGSINHLNATTFHRVSVVAPHTWTLGIVGERIQDWGFLVENEVIPHADYFKRIGHVGVGGLS